MVKNGNPHVKEGVNTNNYHLYFLSKKPNIPKENPIFEDNWNINNYKNNYETHISN